jgi:hypothetical protein
MLVCVDASTARSRRTSAVLPKTVVFGPLHIGLFHRAP